MSDRELIITSATIVQPGDKVLLTLPPDRITTPEELAEIRAHLQQWAPGVDWLLVAGVDTVYQKLGDVPSGLSRESNQASTERTTP